MAVLKLCQILAISAVIALTEAGCGKHKLERGDSITIQESRDGRGRPCANKIKCKGGPCDIVVKCSEFSFPAATSGRKNRRSRSPRRGKGGKHGGHGGGHHGGGHHGAGHHGGYGDDYGSFPGVSGAPDYGSFPGDYGDYGVPQCTTGRGKNVMVLKDEFGDLGTYCDDSGAPDTVIYASKVKILAKGKKFNFKCQITVEEETATTIDYNDYPTDDYGLTGWYPGASTDFPGLPGTDFPGLPGTGAPPDTDSPVFPSSAAPVPSSAAPIPSSAAPVPSSAAPTKPPATPAANSSCTCARYIPDIKRIVGGVDVTPGEFPWQAALRTTFGQHYCGGTVISKSWILTAAHCLFDSNGQQSRPSDIKIYLGDHHMSNADSGETTHIVSKIVLGPNKHATNDIALLKMKVPATFSDKIQPACLPTQAHAGTFLQGKSLWVSGWGTTSQGGGGKVSPTLQKVRVPVVAIDDCKEHYSGQATVGDYELCAGNEGKDSCQGDSGGPAVWADEGKAYIVGVVSWGIGCANKGFPGVYARVTEYLDWIKTTTNGDGICVN